MNYTGIIILIVSRILFDIFLQVLNDSNPQLFSFINKIPESWKGKWYIKWAFIITLLVIVAITQVYVGLNELVGYLIAGLILSFFELLFKKPEKPIKGKRKRKK